MKNISTFQIVLIGAFAFFAVIGLFIFASYRGSSDGEVNLGSVTIWGTVDAALLGRVVEQTKSVNDGWQGVEYVEKDPRTFEQELVNALAAGTGPDLFLLSHDAILAHRDKLIEVPFDSYSERIFKDTFIEEGELYLTDTGLLGLPLTVDPLVLYWNRDVFSSKGIPSPPRYWDELFDLVPRITERDQSSNIVKSAVALGEFRNVRNATAILSALFMQAGTPIVAYRNDGRLSSVLGDRLDFASEPGQAALRFYTEFSNPVKSVYSWNRALPESRQSFLAGDLALYIGFASEYTFLRDANPNLNFDIAPLPQSRDAARRTTFANMHAFAIPKGSSNPSGAFGAAIGLTGASAVAAFSDLSGLPPTRRDLLSEEQQNSAIRTVFYDAALISRGWLDPNPEATEDIFQRMVESTTSGRLELEKAVATADSELELELRDVTEN